MREKFSTFDIIKALDIQRERLRQWLKYGLIRPSIQKAGGQGTRALFSYRDALVIALFRDLIELGFDRLNAISHAHTLVSRLNDIPTYTIIQYNVRRGAKPVNTKTGKPDKTKKTIVSSMILPQPEKINLADYNNHSAEWDYFMVLNLGKFKKEIDIALSSLGD